MTQSDTTNLPPVMLLGNALSQMESRRRLTRMETSRGISPYCLPVINNFVTPVPPATKRRDRGVKPAPSTLVRGRRLRTTTSFSGADISEVLISLWVYTLQHLQSEPAFPTQMISVSH